jgi:hypothetical protein
MNDSKPSELDEILAQYNRALALISNRNIEPFHRLAIAMYAAGISYVLRKVGVEHDPIPEIPEMDLTIAGNLSALAAKRQGDKPGGRG